MSETIQLPDGQVAEMRESLTKTPRRLVKAIADGQMRSAMLLSSVPEGFLDNQGDLPARDVARAVAALPRETQAEFLGFKDSLTELQILALTISWSYGPVTAAVLLDLPQDAYEVLADEAERRVKFQVSEKTLAAMADPTHLSVASSA